MSAFEDDRFERQNLDRLVRIDQARAISGNYKTSLPISVVIAAMLAYISMNGTNTKLIAGWLTAIVIINILKILIIKIYNIRIISVVQFLFYSVITSFVSGLIWTVAPLYISDTTKDSFPIMLSVIGGLTVGSCVNSSPYFILVVAFVLPQMLCVIFQMAQDHNSLHHMFAGATLLFLIFIFKGCRDAECAFREWSRMKHKSAAMAVSLQDQHDRSVEANVRLFQLANHDSLTGLLNRAAFSAALERELETARNIPGQAVVLYLIDLDHFKSINDSMGHNVGDAVLREVATRLHAATCSEDVVARLGGDEFAILRRTGPGLDQAHAMAERLLAVTNGTFDVDDRPVGIGISVGIAGFPDDCLTGGDLLVRADLALYAAKNAGRRRAMRFDDSMLDAAAMARDLERDLPKALQDGALEVWYQPQIALADGRLVGLEALIRWNHPQHSWISPPRIVAAALRTNISDMLTGYVLESASATMRQLAGKAGLEGVMVSVNVSPAELDQYALPNLLQRMIDHHGLNPRRLELEITEEAFVASERAIATLVSLSDMGINLAIDDFGTGCSSIAYFRSLHVHRIKIDQSFVTGFLDRERDQTLVRTMLGIGRSLGIGVIAEGVETAAEAELLLRFGCPIGQGYHFARALSPTALEAFLDEKMACPGPASALSGPAVSLELTRSTREMREPAC